MLEKYFQCSDQCHEIIGVLDASKKRARDYNGADDIYPWMAKERVPSASAKGMPVNHL
jgi:hypothetical protein